jgi:formate transporter
MATPLLDFKIDPYAPSEMAQRAETIGLAKAHLDGWSTLVLGVLAGAFISLGAIFSTTAGTDTGTGYGITRLIMGTAFCLGLILVVIAGAELFTGNNLIIMALVGGKVTVRELLRNWTLVYIGNFLGSFLTVVGMFFTMQYMNDSYKVGATALTIANSKVNLDFVTALARGVMCNALVCLAVWLCYSARSTTDKILSILFPITAFVAAGFEHSIANMYYIPYGILISNVPEVVKAAGSPNLANLTWSGFIINNLIPVTIGNVIGGSVLVGFVYWFVYMRRGVNLQIPGLVELKFNEPDKK